MLIKQVSNLTLSIALAHSRVERMIWLRKVVMSCNYITHFMYKQNSEDNIEFQFPIILVIFGII